MTIVETSIRGLAQMLDEGEVTAVSLVKECLDRIQRYDRSGPCLNAVPVLNPTAMEEAKASDARRAKGHALGRLDGIPYTAKNSYRAKGLTVASGSPAFADLVASDDAFAIERLREAGAILIGLTNMPPMANGGMQRGLYGGVISVRGNWPLVPTMDVVVPHTRSMADMLDILDIIVADDPNTRGDLWRSQPWVHIPKASDHRPVSYADLTKAASLQGKRFAVPAMYINQDAEAGSNAKGGIGGPTGQKIETRASMIDLFNAARRAIEAAGGAVVVTDFPVVTNYESDRVGAPSIKTRN
ncbi:MAG: amidase, partial [Marivivens sp.]|nr:amidase [Marivivens sp.]